MDGHKVAIGNVKHEQEKVPLNEQARADIAQFEEKGNSIVLTAIDGN